MALKHVQRRLLLLYFSVYFRGLIRKRRTLKHCNPTFQGSNPVVRAGGVELYGHRIVGSYETDKALFCLGSWQVQSRSLEEDFRMIVTVLSPWISGWMSV